MIPVRDPASIVILHKVMRPSIDIFSIAEPVYSIAYPVPPAALIFFIIVSIKSFALTPKFSSPVIVIRIIFGLRCQSVCVAKTCSTSVAPMPKDKHPKAPCVEVCESPQTKVIPGRVMPCSGPTTCTMP